MFIALCPVTMKPLLFLLQVVGTSDAPILACRLWNKCGLRCNAFLRDAGLLTSADLTLFPGCHPFFWSRHNGGVLFQLSRLRMRKLSMLSLTAGPPHILLLRSSVYILYHVEE